MEPEVSLPHSQEPAICPYPEPDQSSPCPPNPLPEDPASYYPPIYARFFQLVSFPQISPPLWTKLSSHPYVLRAPLTGAQAYLCRKIYIYSKRGPQQSHSTPSIFIPLYSLQLPDCKKWTGTPI